jgi:triacylglycerol lipase
MRYLRRAISLAVIMAAVNTVPICAYLDFPAYQKILLSMFTISAFIVLNIIPFVRANVSFRLHMLMGGYELVLLTATGVICQVILNVYLFGHRTSLTHFTRNIIITDVSAFLFFVVMAMNGFFRILLTSAQLRILWRAALILTWWIPIINIVVAVKVCRIVRTEYRTEQSKEELNLSRAENEICATKYPIVLVHGVFFRDWQIFNYWGRIPRELSRNGARIYYGRQQSASTIADSAGELKERILGIIKETGCGKVNIIAHSKGGLDARYAVSRLGLYEHVASLTTINTPHKGCLWVDKALKKIPDSVVRRIARRYNAVFTRLGDRKPDFIAAVTDLTAENCRKLEEEMSDTKDVYCQSVMSVMNGMLSDVFPQNLTYLLVKKAEGSNDGLVSEESAKWGNFLGTIKTGGRKGISHGDMIDLQRRNIKDFDVREFYVKIVSDLKARGY